MSISLIHERIRTHLVPSGVSLEQKTINSDPSTSYVGFARAGSSTAEAKWIIIRIKQSGSGVTYRFSRTSATVNDQEQFNKIMDNATTYDYVD